MAALGRPDDVAPEAATDDQAVALVERFLADPDSVLLGQNAPAPGPSSKEECVRRANLFAAVVLGLATPPAIEAPRGRFRRPRWLKRGPRPV